MANVSEPVGQLPPYMEKWHQEPRVVVSVRPSLRKDTRHPVKLIDLEYLHVSHTERHQKHIAQAVLNCKERRPAKKNPKSLCKAGNGLPSNRPGRGYEREVKNLKIIAGLVEVA